jgi:hypothetical protein
VRSVSTPPPRRRLVPPGTRTINVVCARCRWRLAEVWPDKWVDYQAVIYATKLLPLATPDGDVEDVEYLPEPQPRGRVLTLIHPDRWLCGRCGLPEDVDDAALARAVRGPAHEVTLGDDPKPPPLPPLGRRA